MTRDIRTDSHSGRGCEANHSSCQSVSSCVFLVLVYYSALLLLLGGQGTAGAPLTAEAGGRPSSSSTPGPGAETRRPCLEQLHERLEQCLERYEQIFVTFQAETTDAQRREWLRPRLCHQYQVTLQCLHEQFRWCPAQPEHLRLIQVRLGYLRSFMKTTCDERSTSTQPSTSATPLTRTPQEQVESRLSTSRTHEQLTGDDAKVTTTSRPTVEPSSTSASSPRQDRFLGKENNSLWGYTIVTDRPKGRRVGGRRDRDRPAASQHTPGVGRWSATKAPSGVRDATKHPQRATLQLLLGQRGSKAIVELASQEIHLHAGGHGAGIAVGAPLRIVNEHGGGAGEGDTRSTVLRAQLSPSERLDCTVNENGKIDIRCVFSGTQRLCAHYYVWILTTALVLLLQYLR